MAYIDIHADDWLMSVCLVGLKRLYGDELESTPTGVRLKSEQLSSLAERYFNYLINQYNVAKRNHERLKRWLNEARKEPTRIKDRIGDIRKLMNDQIKKVEKYFPDSEEYARLQALLEQVKGVKKVEELYNLEACIEEFYQIMSTEAINDKLTLNYAKSVIVAPFYGQPSFLQKTASKLNKQEHINKMNQDYVVPAQLEMRLRELIHHTQQADKVLSFLEEHRDYPPFRGWLRGIKKLKNMEEIRGYFSTEVLPCSFIDSMYGTISFEEMMFSPLGLSKNNAINFYWDFNKKTPVPMSALAKLILFMAPIGLAFYTRKLGFGQSGEYHQFAGFVLQDTYFEEVYKSNNYYKREREEGGSFIDVILGLLQDTRKRAEKLSDSYLFVEIYSDYESKKTLLDYYHMSQYTAKYFRKYGQSLQKLYLTECRDAFIRSILRGVDPKQTVFRYLREAVTSPGHAYGAFVTVRERYRWQLVHKGVSDVKDQEKYVYVLYQQGKALRDAIIQGREDAQSATAGYEQEPYRASGEKKVAGIAYRLLNAAKSGNRYAFLDTVFRLHVASQKDVSPLFLDILKEKQGLDFETVAGAFIAGLLGGTQAEPNNDSNEKEVATNG
ncbi:CRISPR-associated CXXC_CXXC protein Cst1 [Caldalkalibacillus thermarum TA2.A1]|uniref:CRISPR-associated CXXC_CXXC protein Cst1 n=1 Tax=Caldalkalibacillus thermarum (strain TA2.A1) TaxID=986075 RepID=F5L3V9_CALTT|nr:type I-B CRISPR-associated protein Cas8b1/Cst1 [Caldalkalibacillus thermarum]EGL83969.1 CRISPR-associated CXXC_CXXC protein Cst1 [Caldalkalibacillus thermarum TA2.A1]QZT34740.1 type I-B CRISPR-associated protein Cas8b1/Cst1 [Caldalkalibacillus thermarum TA2.A1]